METIIQSLSKSLNEAINKSIIEILAKKGYDCSNLKAVKNQLEQEQKSIVYRVFTADVYDNSQLRQDLIVIADIVPNDEISNFYEAMDQYDYEKLDLLLEKPGVVQ